MTIHRPRPRPRPRFRPLVLLLTAVTLGLLGFLVPASASAAPYCGITWGSLPKTSGGAHPVAGAQLTNVRAGQHACYDRLVLDVRGPANFASWRVEYVQQVRREASDQPLPLRGGAFLQISFGASDHTDGGTATFRPANRNELVNVSGYRTFRQVAWAGSFENISRVGLGVRARLPFRVVGVTGIPGSSHGTRVVVDVAHLW